MTEPLRNIIDPGWAQALEPVEDQIAAMGEFLRAEIAAGRRYLPAGENVLRAFKQPFEDVRVLIVGQDPYPTPGNAIGLSFSVAPETRRVPPSLVNIFTEYSADLGYPKPANGDLTPWSERGVLLLNRVLTVAAGQAGLAPGQGLGAGDRAGHPGAGGPGGQRGRHADGGDLVGPGRADAGAVARRRSVRGIGASEPEFGSQRVFRDPSVQPRQSSPGAAGRRAGRLEAALGTRT